MDNFFRGFFQKPVQVNLYNNPVSEPYSFSEFSFQQLELLYESLADVRIIEDFIADNIAKIEVGVYNDRDEEIENTELNQLIQECNNTQNWYELIKEAFILFGLTGNSFLFRDPDSGYLYSLLSSDVKINLAKLKTLPEFMNYVSSYQLEIGGIIYPISELDIFHLKMASLNAENGLWAIGSSPYNSASRNIETIEQSLQARISTIKDRGAMGFISNDSQIPDKQQTKLLQDKLKDYGLGEDQQKVMVTTEKLRWQQMSLGLDELKMFENLNYDFDTLCQLRGLDPAIFSSDDSTYANQEQARKSAIKNVIIPTADKFYTKFNDWIAFWYPGLKILPKYETLAEFGEVNLELSSKVISELNAGLLTSEQAFEILYPDGDFQATEIIEDQEIIEEEENEN